MTESTRERARWYPSPAPALSGESDDEYTNRLTGADGTGRRPYDHPRNRQCSIGWHTECTAWRGSSNCACPCHTDKAPPDVRHMPARMLDAAQVLAQLYGLPEKTGLRVMAMAFAASGSAGDVPRDDLTASLEKAYACRQSADFVTDVVNVCQAAISGTLRQEEQS